MRNQASHTDFARGQRPLDRRRGGRRLRAILPAFTIIELLVVMAIISALVAILLPALSSSRERARVAVCTSNMRQIGIGLTAYRADAEPYRLPWYVPWFDGSSRQWGSGTGYGGVQPPAPREVPSIPTALRPLNRYVGVSRGGQGVDKVFHCPADGPSYTWRPTPGGGSNGSVTPTYASAWRTWGNCYTLNAHWLEGKVREDETMFQAMDRLGPQVLRKKIGGAAARFIVAYEDPADIAFWQSGLDAASSQSVVVPGWHGKRGEYTLLFLDGHAVHQYIDTRLAVGPTWSVW